MGVRFHRLIELPQIAVAEDFLGNLPSLPWIFRNCLTAVSIISIKKTNALNQAYYMLYPLIDFLLQQTFHYNAALWNNKETFNLDGGKTGFDSQETKLPSYWNTSFTKICLDMTIGQQFNFIVINRNASSLYSLIADGQFRATSLGRATWKLLMPPCRPSVTRKGSTVNAVAFPKPK